MEDIMQFEMDFSWVMPALVVVGVIVLVIVSIMLLIKAFYKKIDQGQALIVNDMSKTPKVYFTGAMVLPVIHRDETMKISVITLELNRQGKEGLICKDNLRADISVAFYLRVNETAQDVLRVAKSVANIQYFLGLKVKEHISFTSRAKFKYMDCK